MSLPRKVRVECPKCNGHRGICGKSTGAYPGSPATLPCDRCETSGSVWEDTLTEAELNPPPKVFYIRDDNP